MLWSVALKHIVKSGDLTVIDAYGKTHRFGHQEQLPKSVVRLHDARLHRQLFFSPDFYLGEGYMNGTLTLEVGNLNDFLSLLAINYAALEPGFFQKIFEKIMPILQRIQQHNPIGKAAENVAPHYDISDQLYTLFLDKNWQYSCGYYTDPGNNLEQAQEDKMRHIATKLQLKPGIKVLDIGSGWGGLAIYLARNFGVDVTGVTLSGEQAAKATARVREAGLSERVRFLQKDIRELEGSFDRIVSVGMMEHVGVGFYKQLFDKTRALLKPDGVAFFHCIGRFDGPGTTNSWLRKYIFPGGYAPALSEVTKVVEKSRLLMTDIEILRMHYAYTLRDWLARFRARRQDAAALYDERFCRMWEFYLASCEMEFRYMGTMVFQMQLTRDLNALPITRDYMVDAERAMAGAERVRAAG